MLQKVASGFILFLVIFPKKKPHFGRGKEKMEFFLFPSRSLLNSYFHF